MTRPTPQSPPGAIPNPVLVFTGTENYATTGGNYVRYRYDVSNKNSYPAAMFAAAPHLPPCGANANSSRTWINFFNSAGGRIYGFCALYRPQQLDGLWFGLPVGQAPPASVYIELMDRQTNRRHRSNLAPTAR